MKDFTVKKKKKYYSVTYIKYKPTNVVFDLHYTGNVWCISRGGVEKFITYTRQVEHRLSELFEDHSLASKVVIMNIRFLLAQTIGFDIRSKWGVDKTANVLFENYTTKREEKTNECKMILANMDQADYQKRAYYDRQLDIFYLDLPPSSTFPDKVNETLERMLKLTEELSVKIEKHIETKNK